MKHHRPERISEVIKEELSKIIQHELEFDNALMTIINVKVDQKIDEAEVKFTVYPSEKGPDVLMTLVRIQRRLQFLLLRKMNIRPMPRIIFQLEQSSAVF